MATVVQPRRDDSVQRPNIPSAGNRLPGVRDYEQVDRDIIATLSTPAATRLLIIELS